MTSLRRAVLLCSLLLTILPRFAAGQTCTPGGIKNFRGTTNPTSYTIQWDVPAGAPVEAVYEVMQATAGDYCHFPSSSSAYTVIAATTNLTYTAQKTISESAYIVFVRLQSNRCVATDYPLVTDSFSSPPSKPVITSAVASGSTVSVTFNHNDPHVEFIGVLRAPAGGSFDFVDEQSNPCDGSPVTSVDSNVPPGTYQYKLVAYNDGNQTGLNGVESDPVTVVVGGGASLQIVSFAATPPTVRAGQPVTLSWVTQGASSVMIDQGVSTVATSGSVQVTPSTTTTYTLTAMGASTVTSTVTVTVLTAPIVVVSSFPTALLQVAESSGATTRYTLTNAGGTSTQITLSQNQNFFTQSPTSFTLASGAAQVVTVTGFAEPAGAFSGASIPSGNGVTAGLQIPIRLLSATPPSGKVTAQPAKNRVDVTSPSGTIDFTNNGEATLTGIVTSDVPWLIPQSGVVTIQPGQTVTISFTIDRSQRPDSAALIGSAAGNLSLVYLGNGSAKIGRNDTTTPSVSLVTVVDTVQLSVSTTAPPPLAAGEIALFIPGAGHILASVGTFISDLSVLNPLGNRPISDLRFFFTPINTDLSTSKSAAVASVPSNVSVALADVTKNVFGSEGTVGSLQLRSSLADKLGVNTNVFNSSRPAGTFGTAIPTFRSDRAAGQGEKVYLAGLRQDGANSHTNLFIQETAGVGSVTVQTEFLGSDGATLATRSDTASAFGLAIISRVDVPQGTISAIMTNTSSNGGKFLAYATPVDDKSGDNWSVVDWPRQYGYSPGEAMVIPIAGAAQGASAFFRTDATVMNTGTTSGSVQVRYISSAAPLTTSISLGAKQTDVINNVTQTLFGNNAPALGYLILTPVGSTFAITSRTYATDPAHPEFGTYGSGTPTLAVSAALTNGSLRAIGSLEDTTSAAVITKRPATFHTNFGLAEVTGNIVTVRVTLRFTYPAGSKVQGIGTATKDYNLAANGFIPPRSLVTDVLGSQRDSVGDLRGLEADFQVVGGTGGVMVYTSSVDNGTNDSILRTD